MRSPQILCRPLWLAAACFLFLAPSTALDLYVSSAAGNDAGPGSDTAPFRTLQRCIDEWDGLSQVTCHGTGTFHEELLITQGGPAVDSPNRLIPWDTDGDGDLAEERFVLDGQGTRNIGIAVQSGSHNVEIGWLTIRNYEPDGGCGDGGDLHHIEFFCFGGCNDWWIHDSRFENLGVDCNQSGSYISIQPRGVPRLRLERNTFRNIGGYIMRYFAGNGMRILDNTIEIAGTGFKIWDVQPSLDGLGIHDMVIEGNRFLCDGNGTNAPGDPECRPQGGVALAHDTQDIVIRGNEFQDCVGAISIGTDGQNEQIPHQNILIEKNLSVITERVCNPWSGQFFSMNDCSGYSQLNGAEILVRDVTIRNNIIQQIDGGITRSGFFMRSGHPFPFANNIVIEHNTIRGYQQGVRTETCDGFDYQLNGVTVHNNIFSDISDLHFRHGGGDSVLGWSSNNNSYSGAAQWSWAGNVDFAGWQATTGQDLESRTCEPLFRGATDARLDGADTCAIDRGELRVDVRDDFFGNGRGFPFQWDVGAHEWWPDPLLHVTRAGADAVLHVPEAPAGVEAIRYYKGELLRLPEGYSHATPFTGIGSRPECRVPVGTPQPDPGAALDGLAWYYLAVPMVTNIAGGFGDDSRGTPRPPLEHGCR